MAGLVRWEEINSGVNWGVVLLYAAAISLGVQMKDTGAALNGSPEKLPCELLKPDRHGQRRYGL